MGDELYTAPPAEPTAADNAKIARDEAANQRALWAYGAGPACLVCANELDAYALGQEKLAKAETDLAAATPAQIAAQVAQAEVDEAARLAKEAKFRAENTPGLRK